MRHKNFILEKVKGKKMWVWVFVCVCVCGRKILMSKFENRECVLDTAGLKKSNVSHCQDYKLLIMFKDGMSVFSFLRNTAH